jgi:hypothetical protein
MKVTCRGIPTLSAISLIASLARPNSLRETLSRDANFSVRFAHHAVESAYDPINAT